jgi:hypothetical protein
MLQKIVPLESSELLTIYLQLLLIKFIFAAQKNIMTTRKFRFATIVFNLCIAIVVISGCSESPKPKEAPIAPVNVDTSKSKEVKIPIDTALTDYASIISGLEPMKFYSEIALSPGWLNLKNELDKEWALVDTNKIKNIKAWVSKANYLPKDSVTLFYPFAGGDALYSNCFFPTSKKTIMIGLEPIGSVGKDLKADSSCLKYIKKIKKALYTSNRSGYFMTISMNAELHQNDLNGTLPLLLFYARRQGLMVSKIEYFKLDSLGAEKQATPTDALGVNLILCNTDQTHKKIIQYISTDISNGGLEKTIGLQKYIGSIDGKFAFLKAASYLLHQSSFSVMRDLILTNTKTLLQDDSGVPFKFLNDSTWNVQLFGKYTKPIGLFASRIQPELKRAFASTAPAELPFRIGYNISHNEPHLILSQKK